MNGKKKNLSRDDDDSGGKINYAMDHLRGPEIWFISNHREDQWNGRT